MGLIIIPNIFSASKDKIKCKGCGYILVKPYPKDQLCPKCGSFIPDINFNYTAEDDDSTVKKTPKQFETKKSTVADKFGDKIQVKKEIGINLSERIELVGITSKDRTQLYCNNENLQYLLELTNNLDFIDLHMDFI